MSENSEVKTCPYCGEEIKAIAIKCKHCGADLQAAQIGEELEGVVKEKAASLLPKSGSNVWVREQIPPKKVSKAREKYLPQTVANDDIYALGETKALGYLMCGFVLTSTSLHYFGLNKYNNAGAGERKGELSLSQVNSLDITDGGAFKGYGTAVINGMTADDSKSIPRVFDFGKKENQFLRQVFSEILPKTNRLAEMGGRQTSTPLQPDPEPKSGCFKRTIKFVFGLILLIAGIAIVASVL